MGRGKLITDEMADACAARLADYQVVRSAIRALCKYFGGQQIYIPRYKKDGDGTAEDLRGILADAVGDHDAEIILSCIMEMFGGVQVYLPHERNAFRREIADEIYERYNGSKESMGELCREYNMSFMQVYRLWHEAQDDRLQYKLLF